MDLLRPHPPHHCLRPLVSHPPLATCPSPHPVMASAPPTTLAQLPAPTHLPAIALSAQLQPTRYAMHALHSALASALLHAAPAAQDLRFLQPLVRAMRPQQAAARPSTSGGSLSRETVASRVATDALAKKYPIPSADGFRATRSTHVATREKIRGYQELHWCLQKD